MKRTALPLLFALLLIAGTAAAYMRPAAVPGNASVATPVLFGKSAPQEPAAPPVHPIHDDETFDKAKKTFTMIPFSQAELEFSIDLPSDWEMQTVVEGDPQNLSREILGEIARFKSPMIGVFQATVKIQALHLDHEIAAKYWLKNYILSNGYTPEGDIVEIDARRASAAFIYSIDGRSGHSYVTAQITGDIIMLARFDMPLQLKDYISFLQKKSIDGFRMTAVRKDLIEQQKVFTIADAIKFSYPVSWELAGVNFKNMNRLSLRLKNRSITGTLEGMIDFLAVRRTRSTSLMAEVETLRKYMTKDLDFEFLRIISSDKSSAPARFIFNRYEVYDIQSRKKTMSPQEFHLMVLGDKEWYIFAYMITPKEQDNLYTWARNTKTFEEIIRSVR